MIPQEIRFFISGIATILRKAASVLFKLHKKFDKLPANRRFLTFLGLAMLGIITMNTHDLHRNMYVSTSGMIYLVALAISRILYIEGKLKKYAE